MTNGGTGPNQEDVHKLLYDVWLFLQDADETRVVDPVKLSKAIESFKTLHEKTYSRSELEARLLDPLQRCLGTYPYW